MISTSVEQTKKIAQEFSSTLKGGDVVFLEGDLGSGKTLFVQGVLESFGYKDPVRSPTFTIMNIYPIQNHPTIQRIIHMDFYRFETPDEILSLGLDELYQDTSNVFLIEWPEKGFEKIADFRYSKCIKFILLEGEEREIKILI